MQNSDVQNTPGNATSLWSWLNWVEPVANDVLRRANRLQEWVNLDQLTDAMHQAAVWMWEAGFGNTTPNRNCYNSAQTLWQVISASWGPSRCLSFMINRDWTAAPADHVTMVAAIDGKLYIVDPFLKVTSLTQIPEVWGNSVTVTFQAGEAEWSGSGSHVTTYTRLNDGYLKIERRNSESGTVFQTRILCLNDRDNFENSAFNYYEQRSIKYERILTWTNGARFFFQFRVDPSPDNTKFPVRITTGSQPSLTIEDDESFVTNFEAKKEELKWMIGGEAGEALFQELLAARQAFIARRKDIQEPTETEIASFLLPDEALGLLSPQA